MPADPLGLLENVRGPVMPALEAGPRLGVRTSGWVPGPLLAPPLRVRAFGLERGATELGDPDRGAVTVGDRVIVDGADGPRVIDGEDGLRVNDGEDGLRVNDDEDGVLAPDGGRIVDGLRTVDGDEGIRETDGGDDGR